MLASKFRTRLPCVTRRWKPRKSSLIVSITTRLKTPSTTSSRSEEHTSELQSLAYLVCRLLLEQKNADLPKLDLPADLKIPSLQIEEFQKLNLIPALSFISEKLLLNLPPGLQVLKDKVGQLPDLNGITSNPDKAIENAVNKIDGVSEIKGKLDVNRLFYFKVAKTTETDTLSLHDALPI